MKSVAILALTTSAACAALRPVNPIPDRYKVVAYSDTARISSDSVIGEAWASQDAIHLRLRNASSRDLKIFWNDASLVYPSGEASPVMHAGVKYIDCAADKIPTVVPSGARLVDEIMACDQFDSHGRLRIESTFLPEVNLKSAADTLAGLEAAKRFVGSVYRISLPMAFGDSKPTAAVVVVRLVGSRVVNRDR